MMESSERDWHKKVARKKIQKYAPEQKEEDSQTYRRFKENELPDFWSTGKYEYCLNS